MLEEVVVVFIMTHELEVLVPVVHQLVEQVEIPIKMEQMEQHIQEVAEVQVVEEVV